MGKFKVGDRVRLTRDNNGFGDTGDTGEIVRPDAGNEDAFVRFDREINGDHEWYAPWSILELVPVAEADEPANDNGSTAGFTVPLCAYEDEHGWYVTELGRAYADGYAAGLRASQAQAA